MFVALAAVSAPALEIEQLWVANTTMGMEGSPMVVDLDGDGDAEVLTAAYEHLIVVDGSGAELWRYDSPGRYQICPSILERTGASPLIYATDNSGTLTCLDGRGTVVWQRKVGSVFCSSPALADLDGDGAIEVIQGDKTGKVNVLDALTGSPVWSRPIGGECVSPAVGDLDRDGDREIVISTTEGKVFALDKSGATIWTFDVGSPALDWSMCSPIMFGASNGETRIAIGSKLGRLFCLDARGAVVWERGVTGAMASSISAGDYDADGRADLFVITQLGFLYRFDEDGRVLWDIDTQGRSLASGAIIDLDGDGTLEYILSTQNGNLLAFDSAGKIVFNHQFENRTINMTPAFGDIVKSRPGLEFAVTGGESGRITCFGVPGPVGTRAQWRTYRGDNRLTAAWFGLTGADEVRMTPENLTWDRILTGGELRFRVVNPNPTSGASLKAEAVCIRPDGSRQAAVGRVVGRTGALALPISMTAPGVYRIEWMLTNTAGARLAGGSREVTLQPWANDRALARRAILALREAIGNVASAQPVRGVRAAMRREANEIEQEAAALAILQDAAPGAAQSFLESLVARTKTLDARAERALILADVGKAVLAKAPSSRVVPFEGPMWENRAVDRQLPAEIAIPLRFSRRCVQGEHEPVSVKFLNVTVDPAAVGARVVTRPGGPKVTAFEVKGVPSNQNVTAWDPIVPLGARTITIPALETREIWLDVDLAGVAPGAHTVTVVIGGRTGAPEATVEIALDVLPFQMAGYDKMRLCTWARYKGNAIPDMLAHGATVFITDLPRADRETASASRIAIDFAKLDAFVAQLAGHDVFLLLQDIPHLGVEMESDAYVPRFANYIGQVLAHLAERGIAESHVALYPHDEPGGGGWNAVNSFVTFGKQVLKARPGMQIYVDGGGDLPMLRAMAEVTSVWTPPYYWLPDKSPEMEIIRATGKTLWSYDCGYAYARPTGWNTKTINIAGQYRMSAPFAFANGATGIGYWAYNHGPSGWESDVNEFPIVYENPDTTFTSSRRWEAVREGVEDARILIALRDKLADTAVSAEAKASIRHLLERTLPAYAAQSLDEVRLGVARYVLDESNNDATVEAFRREMLDCAAAVSGVTSAAR